MAPKKHENSSRKPEEQKPSPSQDHLFHGFYYTMHEERGYIKYPIETHVRKFIETIILPALRPIDHETYWRKYAKWMLSAVKSSYFAWRGASYWALELDPFVVVEITQSSFRACELPSTRSTDLDFDPEYDIIFTPFDAIVENQTEDWEEMSRKEVSCLTENIEWTNDLHAQMERRISIKNTRVRPTKKRKP